MIKNEMLIRSLNCQVRNYDGLKKLLAATKNRYQALNPELDLNTCWIINGLIERKGGKEIRYQGLENIKDKLSREIEKLLNNWPIWTEWMVKIPGIGPFIAGNLILFYYYRFMPICKNCNTILLVNDDSNGNGQQRFLKKCPACGKSIKGDGILETEIHYKDFPQVSSWWHYLGVHCDENGNKPKKKKGSSVSWSTKGRTICWHIGDQFNRQSGDHLYKQYLLKKKDRHVKKNDDREKAWSDGHIHNAAKNEAAKLFVSHFWHVARVLDGKPTTGPWIIEHGGHNRIIPPYYWDESGVS